MSREVNGDGLIGLRCALRDDQSAPDDAVDMAGHPAGAGDPVQDVTQGLHFGEQLALLLRTAPGGLPGVPLSVAPVVVAFGVAGPADDVAAEALGVGTGFCEVSLLAAVEHAVGCARVRAADGGGSR